jgi:hypothetical protein
MQTNARITTALTTITIHATRSDCSDACSTVSAADAPPIMLSESSIVARSAPIFLNVHKGGGFVSIYIPFFLHYEPSARKNIQVRITYLTANGKRKCRFLLQREKNCYFDERISLDKRRKTEYF